MIQTSGERRIFGCHSFPAIDDDRTGSSELCIKDHEIHVTADEENVKAENYFFRYKRHHCDENTVEKLLTSRADNMTICILPVPPIYISQNLSKHLCLQFKTALVLDKRRKLNFYAKMPIEIGVFKQSNHEGMLQIDCFSLSKEQYTLYGTPEGGIICRYAESDIYAREVEASKFEEALISVHISNDTDKIIPVSKLIIPLENVAIDHRNDAAYLSGRTEVEVGSSFGKDVATVQLVKAKIRKNKLSSAQSTEGTLTFLMDQGF